MAGDVKYDEQLAVHIEQLFINRIVPENFITYIHKYDKSVLTVDDVSRVRKKLESDIAKDVNIYLLHLMMRYKNWFECILKVCGDPELKQEWLVPEFQKIKRELDEKLGRTPDETQEKEKKWAEQVVSPVSPGGGRNQNDGNRGQRASRGARVKMNSSPIIPWENGYFRCIPCDKNTLNSEKQRDDHIQNDKHKSKLNKWIPGTDPPQFKQCDDPRNAGQSSDASADMKSKNVAAAVTITDKNNIHNYGECTLCGVKYQSPEKALEHLKGKPHAKKVAAQKA